MTHRRVAVAASLFALALTLSGCSAGLIGGGSPAPPPPAPSPAASVTMCDNDACSSGTSFNIYDVKMLRLTVNWSNLPAGEHSSMILVRMPDGGIYKRYRVGLTASANGAASWSGILNIHGTNIWAQGLTGAWKVEAVLGDDAAPVSSTQLNLTE